MKTQVDYRVPVPDEVKAHLMKMAELMKDGLPKGWGFAIMLFTYGEGGEFVWLSSAKRDDMLHVLAEFIGKVGHG